MSIFDSIANYLGTNNRGQLLKKTVTGLPQATVDYGSKTLGSLLKETTPIAKDIYAGLGRFGYSAFTGLGQTAASATGDMGTATKMPPTFKLPGINEPIKSYQQLFAERRAAGQGIGEASLKTAGQVAIEEPIGVAFKPLLIGGGLILRSLVGKKGVTETIDLIAKSRDSKEIFNNLKTILSGDDRPIRTLSNQLVNVTDPKDINNIISVATNVKERGFITSVKGSEGVAPQVKAVLPPEQSTYTVLPNEKIKKYAKDFVDEDMAAARLFVSESTDLMPEQISTGVELIGRYQSSGMYGDAAQVAGDLAEKLTKAGQTVQAAKLLQMLDKESVLIQAQRIIKKANKEGSIFAKEKNLTNETAEQLSNLADAMGKTTDDTLKGEFADDINAILNGLKGEPGILEKISAVQTQAQLLNPKTLLTRNPLGNEIFYRLERLNKYVSTPIDWAKSKLTGSDRQVTFRTLGQKGYWKGFIRGAKAGWKGVSVEGLAGQFDAYRPVFTSKWNPLTYTEKLMRVGLQGFDTAAFNRAKNQTIGELAWLRAKNEGLKGTALKQAALKYAKSADRRILQMAHDYGKYVTFQDDNLLSRGLQVVKRGLNVGQKFGLGDLILKYPKTPGAILMRTLEYSPAGFLRSAYLLGDVILRKGSMTTTREVELALSRAITGSAGLTGLGWYLADKGIITGKGEENKRLVGIEQTIGKRGYQVNLSALYRWVSGGFEDKDAEVKQGDKLYSYDWAQPIATSLAIGANMNEEMKKSGAKLTERGAYAGIPGAVESSISGGLETITEQPVLAGIKNFMEYGDPWESIKYTLEGSIASFVPTFSNQIRQMTDDIQRETYSDTMWKRAVNRAKNRVPGVSDSLPPRYDVFGKQVKIDKSPSEINKSFNVFINPGFVSSFDPSPGARIVLDIYNATGNSKVLPRVTPKYLTVYGKKFVLNGKQKSHLQNAIGDKTNIVLAVLANSDEFKKLPSAEQAKVVSNALDDIFSSEKLRILLPEQRRVLIEGLTPDQQRDFIRNLSKAIGQ